MIAWGLYNGQFSPVTLANKAAAAGYEWVAIELDDAETGMYNRLVWPDVRDACHAANIPPGVWFTEGGNIKDTPVDAELSIAELEGPGDYDGIILAINGGLLPTCPIAVCTNFNVPLTDSNGVPQPDKAKPLIDAGFTCLTECYLGDNPAATPEQLDYRAWNLGWPASQAVAGVYNYPKSGYAQWADWPMVDYLGEYVL